MGSNHIHVEDIVKIKIKLSLTKVHFIGLYYTIIFNAQYNKHKNLYSM